MRSEDFGQRGRNRDRADGRPRLRRPEPELRALMERPLDADRSSEDRAPRPDAARGTPSRSLALPLRDQD